MVTESSGVAVDPPAGGNGLSLSDAPPSPGSWRNWLRSYRIVSLWEMYKFRIDMFFLAAQTVENFRGGAFMLSHLRQPVPEEMVREQPSTLKAIAKHCDDAGLEDAQPHIARMLERLEGKYGGYDAARLNADFNELHWRLQDEMGKILVMRIPKDRQEFYDNPLKGWERIVERFPKALSDVEEAHKCMALDRYSAAVFHSVQIVEAGLIELGTFIQVNDPLSGWTSVAQRLKKIIETNYQDLSAFEKANRPFLEQLQGTVEALKNAWRNKISHAHGKLTIMTGEEFHPDVVQEILSATRAFMRRLADGLPEPEATPT